MTLLISYIHILIGNALKGQGSRTGIKIKVAQCYVGEPEIAGLRKDFLLL